MPESDRAIMHFLGDHILSLSSHTSHEDEIAFFPPQGIMSSAFRPEILLKKFFHNFYGENGLILFLEHVAFEIGAL